MTASLKLLLEKLNITVEELNTLKENSLAFTKASAKKFEKLSCETNIDVKNLLANGSLIGYDLTNSFLQPQSSPLPPPIVDTFINPDSVYKYGQRSIHAEGQGDGTITQERRGNADQYDFLHLDWKFAYTPPVSAIYNFNIPISYIQTFSNSYTKLNLYPNFNHPPFIKLINEFKQPSLRKRSLPRARELCHTKPSKARKQAHTSISPTRHFRSSLKTFLKALLVTG